ncbi:MAG: hypothetical protein QXL88_03040 [Candidatus Pacearchaeota archaeon]
MANFDKEKFIEFILDNNIIGFFEKPIKLKSGRMSNWYVNWRIVTGDVYLLDQLANYIIAFTKDLGLKPDCFYGVPEGATKIAIITQYKWASGSENYGPHSHALPMGRAKPKNHGAPDDKYFIGAPRGKTIVLEDVATTGDSLLESINALSEQKVPIIAAFVLTDRMELKDGKSVREIVSSKNVEYFALSNALELLPKAYNKLKPDKRIAKAIEEEFEKYGVEKIKLV